MELLMSLMKAYSVDTTKVTSGITVEFPEGTNADGSIPTFVLAYAGGPNKAYKEAITKRTKGFRSKIPDEIATRILIHVFAETIVLDWSNVQDVDGNVIEYSQANCIKLLTEIPEFFSVLQERAQELLSYLQTDIEDVSKN